MKNLCLIVTILVALAIPASVITATPGFSVLPDEMLTDPKLESRAREISKDIRCLVCQTSRLTIPMQIWPGICASLCANA